MRAERGGAGGRNGLAKLARFLKPRTECRPDQVGRMVPQLFRLGVVPLGLGLGRGHVIGAVLPT